MKIVYGILTVVSSILTVISLTACGGYDSSSANPPSSGGLVINEIDYDQPGASDDIEFIEIHNSSPGAISLIYVALELVDGANDSVYATYNLATGASSIASGGYLVLTDSTVPVAGGAIVMIIPALSIQNDTPDGLRLIDTLAVVGANVIDGLAYEGTMVGTGEGAGDTLEDTGTINDSSLARCPNGQDTDDNDSDFVVTPTTPGADNSCI